MNILNTLEVRWFLDGDAPMAAAARAWFQSVPAEGEREDRYLLTESEGIGLKWRGSAGEGGATLETKYLLGSLGPTPLHDRFVGRVERWRKLTMTVGDDAIERDTPTLGVAKKRRLRKLAYEDGKVTAVDPKARPKAGCGVELTEVAYAIGSAKMRALTIGLEAFGPEPLLLDVLLRASPQAFAAATNVRLEAATSASYPRWLIQATGAG